MNEAFKCAKKYMKEAEKHMRFHLVYQPRDMWEVNAILAYNDAVTYIDEIEQEYEHFHEAQGMKDKAITNIRKLSEYLMRENEFHLVPADIRKKWGYE